MATFYLGYEFKRAWALTSSGGGTPTIVKTRLHKANKITPNTENKTYQWEGDATVEKLESLFGISYNLDLASIPVSAHADLFNKDPITAGLPAGLTSAYGLGGGDDAAGLSCGMVFEGLALKDVDGVRSRVDFALYLPVGTLTLRALPGMTTGNVFDAFGYTFTATKTTVNIIGAALTGIDPDGEFLIVAEGALT